MSYNGGKSIPTTLVNQLETKPSCKFLYIRHLNKLYVLLFTKKSYRFAGKLFIDNINKNVKHLI